MGYDVCCFIGIILKFVKDYEKVIVKFNNFFEVVEVYYIMGNYFIFIKVMIYIIEEFY